MSGWDDFGGTPGYRSGADVNANAQQVVDNQVKGRQALLEALKSLYESGDFSDITIKCGTDEYKVHKAIICPRSRYFDTMFKAEMKEKNTSQVDMSDSDAEAVKLMVHYFYHLDYLGDSSAVPLPYLEVSAEQAYVVSKKKKKKLLWEQFDDGLPEPVPTGKTFVLQHCRVYALAEMCQLDDLKSLAASKFRVEVQKYWNHPDFFEAIQEIYTTTLPTDRELRDIVVDVLKRHKQLLDNEDYKKMVSQLDLAFELLMAVHKQSGWTSG